MGLFVRKSGDRQTHQADVWHLPRIQPGDRKNEALALTVAVKSGQDPAAKRRAQYDAKSFEKLAQAYLLSARRNSRGTVRRGAGRQKLDASCERISCP